MDEKGKVVAAICHAGWVLVSAGICLEKIRQTRRRHFNFSCPVVTVYLPTLSINHVMAHHFDLDVFKTQIEEIGVEFTAGVRIEIVAFFQMTRKFGKDLYHRRRQFIVVEGIVIQINQA